MKILYIHQYFKTPAEPGARRSYWMARRLVKAGHQVVMLTSRNQQVQEVEKACIDGIEVIYIRNRYENRMSFWRRKLSFLLFIVRATSCAFRQKDIQLVLATSTPLTVAVPALLLKSIRKIPFVFEVRDLWPEAPRQLGALSNPILYRLALWLEKRTYQQAAHIIALSPDMKQGIARKGIETSGISLIPNMSMTEVFYPQKANPEVASRFEVDLSRFNVIYFGAMGPANGLEYILEAAALLQAQGKTEINFVLTGEGKAKEALEAKARQEQLTNVQFLPPQPLTMLTELVNLADCSLVCFADYEILGSNSPNKFFDSLAAGLPVIVNSAGWTKALVEKHQCGMYVNPRKTGALVETLSYLCAHRQLCWQMGENARRLAEEEFEMTKLSQHFVEILETYGPLSYAYEKND